jgi:hypothetical protein
MIDFTKYIYDYPIVKIIDPYHHGFEALADSGVLFVHNIEDDELSQEWVNIWFAEESHGKKIVLQTYYLGYIGI